MTAKREVLTFDARPELGGEGDQAGKRLVGYAAKWDAESHPIRRDTVHHRPFVEVLRPGCFDEGLRSSPDVRALYDHQKGALLGRTTNGTLRLWTDAVGLAYDVLTPDTSVGADCRELVRRGDIDGCSLGMYVMEDEFVPRDGPTDLRIVREAVLFEVTPACVFPAYGSTTVALRSLDSPDVAPGRPAYDRARRWLDLLSL